MSIIADEAFYDLDGPLVRITTPHCPLPAADILEDAILPTVDRIVDRVQKDVEQLTPLSFRGGAQRRTRNPAAEGNIVFVSDSGFAPSHGAPE